MSGDEYYFAFGSFMGPEFMQQHGVKFHSRVPAHLTGYEFKFSVESREAGTAISTIVPNKDKTVHGVLYHLPEGGIERLDEIILHRAKEGSYDRIEVSVVLSNSSSHQKEERLAKTYIARPEIQKEGLKANPEYLKLVLAAADALPDHYVNFLKSFEA